MIEHDLTTVFSLKASDSRVIPFSIGDKNVWLDDWTKYNYGTHLVIILINMAFYGKHHLVKATKDCNIAARNRKKRNLMAYTQETVIVHLYNSVDEF